MKRNYKNFSVCLSVVIFLVLACDGGSNIKGHVYDSANNPIQNASVKFEAIDKGEPAESYQSSAKTDRNGSFNTGFVHSPYGSIRLKLTVSKEGYKSNETEFSSTEAYEKQTKNEEFKIILEKE